LGVGAVFFILKIRKITLETCVKPKLIHKAGLLLFEGDVLSFFSLLIHGL